MGMNHYGYYETKVILDDNDTHASDNFDIHDMNYIHGDISKRPLDFDLHLSLFLLEKEHLPDELLNQLKDWSKNNKMVLVSNLL